LVPRSSLVSGRGRHEWTTSLSESRRFFKPIDDGPNHVKQVFYMSDVKQRQVPNRGGEEEGEDRRPVVFSGTSIGEEEGDEGERRPVVFSGTSIDMPRWHVARYWVKPDDEGGVGIDWDHLCREHGDELVPVKSSSTAAATTTTMTLAEYRRDHWHRSDKVGVELDRRALAHRTPRLTSHSRFARSLTSHT